MCLQCLDPESLEWCSLDDDYRRKLDGNPYVSLSRERRLAQEQSLKADPKSLQDLREMQETPELGPTAEGLTRTVPTSSTVPETIDDNDYELDSEGSNDETEIPEGSLFDYNMPGVLTADEVAQLDLDHWKIVVRGRLVDFEVRSTVSLTNDGSIHCIDMSSGLGRLGELKYYAA